MADCFEKADAGGDGDVEALDLAGHGDLDEEIAMLTGEAAHAGAFGAHDDADGAFEVGLVDGLGGFIGGADEPDAEFFEFVHSAGEIDDADDGDIFGTAAGDAEDGLGDGGGFVFGEDDSGDASGVSGAEAGPEVVGVLHAIENENKGVGVGFDEAGKIPFIIDFALGLGGALLLAVAVGTGGTHGGDKKAQGGSGCKGE